MLLIAALALPVGAAGAAVSWILLRLIGLITNAVFYQRLGTALVAPGGSHHNPFLILFAPIVGGLVVGVMARFGSERIRGHGMPEAMEAILLSGSKVSPRVAIFKPLSAAVAIGTGGPFGAEGPIIVTGGAIGSLAGQLVRLTADERKTLLVAGAASGMAATFNSPFAALMLAVELLLFEFRPRSFVPVAAAVSTAAVVRQPLLGTAPLFLVNGVLHVTAPVYGFAVLSGIAAALLSWLATMLVYASDDLFRRLPVHWMWWPALGGLIIGVGGLFVPQALGVGYNIIGSELAGSISIGLVSGILIVKTLIWSMSLGSGTSGGVLAPMFMIGGALGALEAHIFPAVGPGFWALIALAGILSSAMGAPLTGIVFALELTHRFGALLPLLIGSAAAYAVSVLILKRSILTEKIARRGFHLSREYDVDPLEMVFVEEVMQRQIMTFTTATSVYTALQAISGTNPTRIPARRQMLYPVVDESSTCLVGVITRTRIETAVDERRAESVADLMITDPVVADPDQTARVVVAAMAVAGVDRMPVVDRADSTRLVGLITVTDLLAGRLRDEQERKDEERVYRLHRRRRVRQDNQPPMLGLADVDSSLDGPRPPQP